MTFKQTSRSSFFVVLFIWMPAVLMAQSQLDVMGPDSVKPGSLVRLAASLEAAETPFWIVLQPINLDYEQVDQGRRLIFAVGCKEQQDIVVLLLAQSVKDGRIATRQVRRTIKIKANTDDEKPSDEQPKPGAPEPLPPDKLKPVFDAIGRAMKRIADPVAKNKAPQVAANFRAVAARCRTNRFDDVQAIWLTLSKLNNQSLGQATRSWEPVAIVLQAEFKRLKITKVADHAAPLEAAAKAIEQATIQGVNQ